MWGTSSVECEWCGARVVWGTSSVEREWWAFVQNMGNYQLSLMCMQVSNHSSTQVFAV